MTDIDDTGCGDHKAERGPFMQTYSGVKFHLLDPRPEDVLIDDLAHHLALQCRYAGATRTHYSVAQHCVVVSKIVPAEYALYGLLHDAAEAYCQDQIRPMKLALDAVASFGGPSGHDYYKEIESRIRKAIFAKFGLSEDVWNEIHDVIKKADNVAVSMEKRDVLYHAPNVDWGPMEEPLKLKINPLPWHFARSKFRERLKSLKRNPVIAPAYIASSRCPAPTVHNPGYE